MYTLITSIYNGNNEINTVEESNSLRYLENKALESSVEDAYIVKDDVVIERMEDDEFIKVENSNLPTNLDNNTNEIIFINGFMEVTITTYENKDDECGNNSYITISKDLTIKDLKKVLKDTYKCTLKSIDIDDVEDNTVLRDCESLEGNFYNKTNAFDIYF